MKPVICGGCHTHVYDFLPGYPIAGTSINPNKFKGVGSFPDPQPCERMKCPNCKRQWHSDQVKETADEITVRAR